jgi:hypothetical protein
VGVENHLCSARTCTKVCDTLKGCFTRKIGSPETTRGGREQAQKRKENLLCAPWVLPSKRFGLRLPHLKDTTISLDLKKITLNSHSLKTV